MEFSIVNALDKGLRSRNHRLSPENEALLNAIKKLSYAQAIEIKLKNKAQVGSKRSIIYDLLKREKIMEKYKVTQRDTDLYVLRKSTQELVKENHQNGVNEQ